MKKLLLLSLTLICLSVSNIQAQGDPYIGEVKMFAGNFAPKGWAFCNGRLLEIKSNEALFEIIGTTYGGNGRTTFALPDLRGRVPMGSGNGPGLTPRKWGSRFGSENTTISYNNLPTHKHTVKTYSANPKDATKGKFIPGNKSVITVGNESNSSINTTDAGRTQSFSNIQPSMAINFIICIQGTFPARN